MVETLKSKIVGDLKCQHFPYLKEYVTKVVSCTSYKSKNKKEKRLLYKLELEDTILFPEGGGQPSDSGTINDINVIDVIREDLLCYHIVDTPFQEGDEVLIKLDFDRRFDHMQQHSGQHFLSAVIENMYNLVTGSWLMGETKSYIELPISFNKFNQEMVNKIEKECNRLIRECIPYSVESFDLTDKNTIRPDSLPLDYGNGIVRVVTIKGLEKNPCCGTHVNNSSQLQAIKLLNFEKNGNDHIRLFFLVGDRILKSTGESYFRDKELSLLLSSPPDMFTNKVQYYINQNKEHLKQIKNLTLELCSIIKEKMALNIETKTIVCHHQSDISEEFSKFMNYEMRSFTPSLENKVVLISGSTYNSKLSSVMILGDKDKISKTLEFLKQEGVELKGAFSKDLKWSGKCLDWAKLIAKFDLIENELKDSIN